MPEFVTCPVCGRHLPLAWSERGQSIRCVGCDHRFFALADSVAPRRAKDSPSPTDLPHSPLVLLCPGCGEAVTQQEQRCPRCGEEFEEFETARQQGEFAWLRRDGIPHRAQLLTLLANVCLLGGVLSLCTCGLGSLLGIPLGLAVVFMARADLQAMRLGEIDPRGQMATRTALLSAQIGLGFSVGFAVGYVILFLGYS